MTLPKFIAGLLTSIVFYTGLYSAKVNAQQCNVQLHYGIIIDSIHIRIIENDKTYIQINAQDQLFVNGREIELSNHQRALMKKYSSGIRKQVPLIVNIATEGVDVGLAAVNTVIANLTGENSEAQQELQTLFEEIKWRIRKRFNHTDSNYYIAPQSFDDFDELFAGQFEEEIEKILKESLGSILIAVGEAITNRADNQNTTNETSFEQRIERIGEELELKLRPKVKYLKSKANNFCMQLGELDLIEKQLSESIPALKAFDLIQTY